MRLRQGFVVTGFLFSLMVLAGVAGAEPEPGTTSSSSKTSGGTQATSVSGDQYSEAGDEGADSGTDKSRGDGGNDSPGNTGGDGGKDKTRESRGKGSPEGNDDKSEGGRSLPEPSDTSDTSGTKPGRESGSNSTTRVQRNETRQVTSQDTSQSRVSKSGSRGEPQRQKDNVSRESGEGSSKASSNRRVVRSPEIRTRVKELRKQEEAGDLPPAATNYDPSFRGQELRIAREEIVSKPVDEVSLRRYKKLYEEAAEEYGFGEDWYVLAAVGKVESDHGQNMGPSSAGALGPMQFMPSTWEAYGLDANDDGKANIMDPEDAIPSAARYLKAGGAPDDWYQALYTYNHAGWYVEKVLRVAERYRLAAGDEEVGPYYLEDR